MPAAAAKPRYDFPVQVFEALPPEPPRFGHDPLPFRDRWTALAAEIERDGKPRGFYVPACYFVEVRGAPAEKVNHGYIKQKLGEAWGKWVKESPAAKRAERFELVKNNRTGKGDGFEEQGFGVLAIVRVKA
ncbi:hypothetical protein [Labrys monachus]|uniref:Uncharacterized protein n=1 Tax=Labrys monachus TaxID=217067 RepID=A0ABU0FCA6_9HYPH|nr:hypothetical protein [Labrys monachus]MDQ0392242.1 hypothetical protein [Labrys monachus]